MDGSELRPISNGKKKKPTNKQIRNMKQNMQKVPDIQRLAHQYQRKESDNADKLLEQIHE
jgi:hypothetical protein